MTVTWPSMRVVGLVAGVVILVVALVGGIVFWSASHERRAKAAYADVMTRAQASQGPEVGAEIKATAIQDLEKVLQEHPSATDAPRAAYQLGNLKYALKQYGPARAAFEIALAKSQADTVRTLARAGVGYTWEAEKDYQKAASAYEAALAGRKPSDFMYEELLLDLGRVQEMAGRKDDAIKTYRRALENPKSLRADDVKAKLARMGATQ